MAVLKVVMLCGLVVACAAQLPVVVKGTDAEYNPHPQYQFSYTVNDPVTGDAKAQEESRDGDVVRGSYSLVEPDGSLRTVTYTADPVNGFNAQVNRALGAAPAVAVKAAPAVIKAAPLAATPVYRQAYAHPYYNYQAYPYAQHRYAGYPYAAASYATYPYSYNGYNPYTTYPYAY